MVVSGSKPMSSWFSFPDLGLIKRHSSPSSSSSSATSVVGVLSFEIAKTMSRLISLYKSLSDDEIYNLKYIIIKSEGIAYLSSKDESYLLNLAFSERLEELDDAANVISRLGRKCSDFGLMRFDLVYSDLKVGSIDMSKMDYGSRDVEKLVQKLEKYISTTSMLHTAIDSLTELEASEKKLSQWRRNVSSKVSERANFDLFDQKIAFQRRQVRHFRQVSLWNQTLDKSVAPMAQITCIIYARLCKAFTFFLSGLPSFSYLRHNNSTRITKSGPILKTSKKSMMQKFHSGELNTSKPMELFGLGNDFNLQKFHVNFSDGKNKNNRVFHTAPPTTVGGAGLALRYANLILLVENYLADPASVSSFARQELYHMLPEKLRTMVGSKLRKCAYGKENCNHLEQEDLMLAEGWREGLKGILDWIAPMAKDTMEWQIQRSWEKKRGFEAKQRVLMIQTLHYADLEKTEAAIVELLVGLSCVYKYENRFYSSH